MEYITIAREESLLKLSKLSGIDPAKLEEEILIQGEELEILGDDQDLAGKSIQECMEDQEREDELPVLTFMITSEYTEEMADALKNCIILASGMDCPHCGCDLERYSEKEWGKDYDVERCHNPSCDYESRTQVRIRDEWE